jgi:hypothetical protein
LEAPNLIEWASPVPFFGTLATSRIATVGINPSNREFVDKEGNELAEAARRLPTLRTLGLHGWNEASYIEIRRILEACSDYFYRNPYDRWFRKLDAIIVGTGSSFYEATACHLDLVPYATRAKWAALDTAERQMLLANSGAAFGQLLRDSPLELLVLNGKSVVHAFEALAETRLTKVGVLEWGLPRTHGVVPGFESNGRVKRIGGVDLGRLVNVVGFNHNIQSSYGVTTTVVSAIADRVGRTWEKIAS